VVTRFVCIGGHTLLESVLTGTVTVIDAGANHGGFARGLRNRHPGSYHAIEANPELAAELERSGSYESVTNAALTDHDGTVSLQLGRNDEASSILPLPDTEIYGAVTIGTVQIPAMSLTTLLSRHPDLDVLKLDIEGAETRALLAVDPKAILGISQITVEFHGAPQFGFGLGPEVKAVIRHLRGNGFVALQFEPEQRDVLFVSRRLASSRARILIWKIVAFATRCRWVANRGWSAFNRRRRRVSFRPAT
jgi:FkbM family methyltransferase